MRDTVKSVILEEFLCKLLWSSLKEMENILILPQGSAVKQWLSGQVLESQCLPGSQSISASNSSDTEASYLNLSGP